MNHTPIKFEDISALIENEQVCDCDDIEMSSESLIGLFKNELLATNVIRLSYRTEFKNVSLWVHLNDNLPKGQALFDYGNYGENTTEIILPN